eukprot:scaffold761_cov98-Cylindrotheca_fusiformis.AAC.1
MDGSLVCCGERCMVWMMHRTLIILRNGSSMFWKEGPEDLEWIAISDNVAEASQQRLQDF